MWLWRKFRSMTDEEIVMFLHYYNSRGVTVPNPENYPKTFMWYVKTYKYMQSQKVK